MPDIAEALKAMASGVAEPQREPELPDAALGGHDRAYAEMAMSDVEDMHKPEDIPDGEDGALTKNGKTTLDDVGQAFMRQMDGVRAKISTLGDQVRRVASQTHTAAKADSDVAPTQGAASDSIQKGVRATERAPAAPALPEPPDGIFYKGAAGSVSRSAIETKSFHVRTDAVRAVEFATLPWHQLPSVVIGFLVTLLVAIVIFFLPADARFILLLVTALIAFQYFKRESDNFKSKQVITLTMNDGTKKYIVEREAIATEMEAFASAVMKVIRR